MPWSNAGHRFFRFEKSFVRSRPKYAILIPKKQSRRPVAAGNGRQRMEHTVYGGISAGDEAPSLSLHKPKLQISLGPELVQNYPAAVEACGAAALAGYLPEPKPEECAGLILSGGGDVDPALYGEENSACFGIDRERDAAEFRLIEAYLRAGKPILGICRGQQLLNVYFGGSLIQHLPTAERHVPSRTGDNAHSTGAQPGSFLAGLYGEAFPVNSAHHQAVGVLAGELTALQWAEDGVIEACRHRSLPVFSVQWHPERMCLRHARADTVDGLKLFRWFVHLTGSALK